MTARSGENPVGVVNVGFYVPPFAVRSRKASLAVGNGDEDGVTIAVQAAATCLERAGGPGDIDALYLSLGNAPLAEGPQAEIVREALGLPASTELSFSMGDQMAVASHLRAAFDAISLGRIDRALVVAAEGGDGSTVAAGAVAMIIARSASPLLSELATSHHGDVAFARWRAPGDKATRGDSRYIDERVQRASVALARTNTKPGPALVCSTRFQATAAHELTAGTVEPIPDAGVATLLFGLLTAARRAPGERVAAFGFGDGGAWVVAVDASPDTTGIAEPRWPDMTAPAPIDAACSPELSLPTYSPFFTRGAHELLRAMAQKCATCGHVAFPPSQRPVCSSCQGTDWAPYALPRSGHVYTFTVNKFLPGGFGDSLLLILGELEDGTRYWAPTSGIREDEIEIGMPVRLGLRRYTNHDGAPAYAMKFVPADAIGVSPSDLTVGV